MTTAHRSALSFSAAVALGLALFTAPAQAEKVGVAAAVNPDAFSSLAGKPQTQLNIGKSIFYNERINTTGSGLVQVLLVDGSTFTVGPGSDLVIDKFVYDPRKGTGQIAASFSKGVARFVGGKISKNEGGVNIETPAGALAVRGGIAYLQYVNPKNYAYLFVFGDYLKMNGKVIYEPGNGFINGSIKPFNAALINSMMASLTNSNPYGGKPPDPPKPSNTTWFNTQNLYQLIVDATTESIITQGQEAAANQGGEQPTQTRSLGYASGMFLQTGGDEGDPPLGSLTNLSPSEVALLFNGTDGSFSGAQFTLYVDGGAEGKGGVEINFSPVSLAPDVTPPAGSGVFFGGANSQVDPNAITVYQNTIITPTGPQLSAEAVLNSGTAGLIGVTGSGEVFCSTCDFLKWGAWIAALEFQDPPNADDPAPPTQAAVVGAWVAGDLPTIGQLPFQGTANYSGRTIGTATIYNESWQTYTATGNVHMNWDFGERSGTLHIANFVDSEHNLPVLNMSGTMNMPGQLSEINKFSGPLSGTLGSQNHFAESSNNQLPSVQGSAVGSFAANGSDTAAGIIGNWNAKAYGDYYRATGIFGAGRNGQQP